MKKHKVYTLINILGLSIGMAVCITIFLFVKDEISYDAYHENADRIFRVERYGMFNGKSYHNPNLSVPMGDALKNEYPEILERVRFRPFYVKVQNQYQNLQDERIIAADENLFDVFSFRLLKGDENSALTNPYSIILTQSMADRYLKKGEAIGQT
jgi:putative ABC transport system permease protein